MESKSVQKRKHVMVGGTLVDFHPTKIGSWFAAAQQQKPKEEQNAAKR